jgi:hypothetical protein
MGLRDIAAGIRFVARDLEAQPPCRRGGNFEKARRHAGPEAIAQNHARLLRQAKSARGHRMAVEQDGGPEPSARFLQHGRERAMIGAVDGFDAPVELARRQAPPPDRSCPGDARRNKAESAAAAGRLQQRARRGRRRHHAGVDLPFVTVEIDLGARSQRDQCARPFGDSAPDQPVDQPVLEHLQRLQGTRAAPRSSSE